MDDLYGIESLGFTLPTPAYLFGAILFGAILFGLIGFAAYRYGKKTSRPHAKWIGVVLMLYRNVVSETWMMYVVGAGLCMGLYWFRE